MISKPDNSPSGLAPLLDRDKSILAFNERVLAWAHKSEVPLLERLRYLCIVASNLDEFFEVRAAPHLAAREQGGQEGGYSVAAFNALARMAHELVARQYALYNDELMPALARQGIRVLSHGERNGVQRRWVRQYFEREVRPLLVPVSLDPAHPFPMVANKSLNFIVRLDGRDAFGRGNEIAIVKVPRALPRLIRLPAKIAGRGHCLVSLSSVIRAHLQEMFVSRGVTQFSQFRVTRHSDLAVDEMEVKNLRTALRQGLQQRHFGEAVRLEVSSGCSEYLAEFLLSEFKLPSEALYRVHGPLNMVRFRQLIDLVPEPKLLFKPHQPGVPMDIRLGQSMFERLREGDALVHQPYESFAPVLEFLREAVRDPDVMAIKQTVYRTGTSSEMMDLLLEAVQRGKEVTAVVELKARFDEETNINWAEKLEAVGAQVVYGVVGLKTHAKMLLVTRREGARLHRYVHLSTGNYNPDTARLYTDFSYFSADPALTGDVDNVFLHLASQIKLPRLARVLISPLLLHRRLLDIIESIGAAAEQGTEGRIVLKMNALTDEPLIRALMLAGVRGVRIDLIVRGACILPPGLPGLTGNIRVRSIIGRFLEHSRVFYFRTGTQESLYLSSADLMNRNMLRRIELAWPVLDPRIRQRIIDECLVPCMLDSADAWDMDARGHYRPARPGPRGVRHSAQLALMALHQAAASPGRAA